MARVDECAKGSRDRGSEFGGATPCGPFLGAVLRAVNRVLNVRSSSRPANTGNAGGPQKCTRGGRGEGRYRRDCGFEGGGMSNKVSPRSFRYVGLLNCARNSCFKNGVEACLS